MRVHLNVKKVNVYNVADIIADYKRNWTQGLLRMNDTRSTKLV